MSKVVYYKDIPKENLNEGVSRKVLAYDKNVMSVEVSFETGSIGALHSHPHEQVTYVLSGTFEFEVEGVKSIVNTGDTLYFSPDALHGAVCIAEGKLLDIFSPLREDFIK